MVIGIVSFVIAAVFTALFWIWLVRGILSKIYKTPFGRGNVAATIAFAFFSWIFILIGSGFSAYWLMTGGASQIAEKVSYSTAVNMEAAKKGWTKGLLKKMGSLSFSIEKICEIDSKWEGAFKKSFSSDDSKTYEAYLIVQNPSAASSIRYADLRKSNIAYACDDEGVMIPAFIINHAEFDEIPVLFKWLLPRYRLEQKNEFIPGGKSYLNIRVDIPEGHKLMKIGLADKVLDVSGIEIEKVTVSPLNGKDNAESKENGENKDIKVSEEK